MITTPQPHPKMYVNVSRFTLVCCVLKVYCLALRITPQDIDTDMCQQIIWIPKYSFVNQSSERDNKII